MNVYLFELRRAWKSAAVWTAVLFALFIGLIAGFYPAFLDSRVEVERALANLPPEFAAAFGMEMDNLFSYGGFYAFSFLYMSLLGAIMAASLGIDMFAREKRAKCTDFLLTKPRTRSGMFVAKLLSVLTLLVFVNALYLIASLVLCSAYGQESMGRVALAASALFFTQLLMLSVAIFAAIFMKRVRSVSASAMMIGFGGFLLTALHSLLEDDALRYIAPFKYFSVSLAFSEGRFETPYVLTAAAITLVLLVASHMSYCRGDAHAV